MRLCDLNLPKCTVPKEEILRLKGLGCLRDKTTPDAFNVRVITKNGFVKSEDGEAIAEAAKKFGNGSFAMTTRLTVEIQSVPYANIQPLFDFLASRGLSSGGTGPKVRPIVACKGTTCSFGLIDTYGLSEKIHYRFYEGYHGVKLPHKFKICVGGCPNNCAKPNLNDLGIIGQRIVKRDPSRCRGCKRCLAEEACPIKVFHAEGGEIKVSDDCNNCGRCVPACPFGVTEEFTVGYAVYIGGRYGKKWAMGKRLSRIFESEEEVLDLIEKCILLFKDKGTAGERFADTVERLGFSFVEQELFSDEILSRKGDILS